MCVVVEGRFFFFFFFAGSGGGGALLNFCVRGPRRDCTDTADPESR